MRKTVFWSAQGLALLALMLGTGCDDSSPSGTPGDATVDAGPDGGRDSGPTGPCLEDGDCADSQYCDIEDGAFSGTCRDGCREGSCPTGQECGDYLVEGQAGADRFAHLV